MHNPGPTPYSALTIKCRNVTIEGIQFETVGHGIKLEEDVSGLVIDACTFKQVSSYRNSVITAVSLVKAAGVVISNCRFTDCYCGGIDLEATDLQDIRILSNMMAGMEGNGIKVGQPLWAIRDRQFNYEIRDNCISDLLLPGEGYGIVAEGTNGRIYNNQVAHIRGREKRHVIGIYIKGRKIRIGNNVVEDLTTRSAWYEDGVTKCWAFYIQAKGLRKGDERADSVPGYGNEIYDNTLRGLGNGGHGVGVMGQCEDLIWRGNTITGMESAEMSWHTEDGCVFDNKIRNCGKSRREGVTWET